MFKKWIEKSQQKQCSRNGFEKLNKNTMFKKWAKKQIRTHLHKCKRKPKHALVVVVAVVAAVAVVTAAAATTATTTAATADATTTATTTRRVCVCVCGGNCLHIDFFQLFKGQLVRHCFLFDFVGVHCLDIVKFVSC